MSQEIIQQHPYLQCILCKNIITENLNIHKCAMRNIYTHTKISAVYI